MVNKLEKILKVIESAGGCMCGSWESCDNCSNYSSINILKKKIKEIINGKKKTKPEKVVRRLKYKFLQNYYKRMLDRTK